MYELEKTAERESAEDFRARVAKAIQIIKDKSPRAIAILSHGATLGEMCRQLKIRCKTGWANAEVQRFDDVVFP